MRTSKVIALLLVALCGPAVADARPVQRLSCTHLSGGRMQDFVLVVDDKEKTLDMEPDFWFSPSHSPGPDAATFKTGTIEWTYMRGYAVLDRKTGIVDWDDTGEHDYLDAIGHADPRDSEDNYRGKLRCTELPAR
ncbi:MAG: hypothetical protein JO346_01550 [Alphaproteobacteria bacterium]|nr:hypothetical protein [Alphaproteobacteria bacterium]